MSEMQNKKRIEKIYGSLPLKSKIKIQKNVIKIGRISLTLVIALLVFHFSLKGIEPIMDAECVHIAKSIATRVSNEQATKVMSNYQYDDLMRITKDEEGKIKLIDTDITTVNRIISDIPVLIQEELAKEENCKFYLKLGTLTGSDFLAGRGPNVEIKMKTQGSVETNLKSEFSSAGINQTLHRIYLEIGCDVEILTPFHTRKEKIVNQVLLAEGVIVGDIPATYYNLEGLNQDQVLDPLQ